MGGQTSQWVEVEQGLFQNIENGSRLTFEADSSGRASHIYTKIGEEGVLERVAWYETLTFQAGLLILMSLVFLAALVITVVMLVKRGRGKQSRGSKGQTTEQMERATPWLAGILAGLDLIFLAGLAAAVAQSTTTRAPQAPAFIVELLVIPLITSVLTFALLAVSLRAWITRSGFWATRVFYSVVALAGLAFTWFAWYWNLLGFRL